MTEVKKTVKISRENYRRLIKLMSKIMSERGEKVSIDEALKYLFEKAAVE